MTAPHARDLAYVAGALILAFGAIGTAFAPGLTAFGLWPDFLKLAAWTAIFCGIAFAFGYSLAWSRREDRSA